jgi:hypothetical protein
MNLKIKNLEGDIKQTIDKWKLDPNQSAKNDNIIS